MERNPSNNDQRDRQLDRLSGRLRDQGLAPERDLWPGINAAIDRQEAATGRRVRRRPGGTWLKMTAAAAALTVMLAAGWVGIRTISGNGETAGVAGEGESPASGLAVIDKALDELTLALADDPENRNLSHLVLMVHKTRGNLLRRTSVDLLRD